MKKIKFISIFLIIMFCISGFSSVKAAEIQNDSISIEKTITNYVSFETDEGGEINLKISNIVVFGSPINFSYVLYYITNFTSCK